MARTRIVIIEDNQVFRMGLEALFEKTENIKVIASTDNGKEGVRLVLKENPDLVLMDINLPSLNGCDACKEIITHRPFVKVLGISHENCEEKIMQMINAGALGYVMKDIGFTELKLAVHTLVNGDSYFCKEVTLKLLARLRSSPEVHKKPDNPIKLITVREKEILQCVANELSNREIADRLYISPRTVETHKRNLIQKLKVKNTIGLVKYYLMNFQQFSGTTF